MKFLRFLIPTVILLSVFLTGCASGSSAQGKDAGYKQISGEEAAAMMEKDDGHIILDVRRQDEYASGHIPGAICIPNETITAEKLPQLPDPDQIVLVYCRSGNRSKQASEKLAEAGYKNVYEFGGIIDWTGEIVTGDEANTDETSEEPATENKTEGTETEITETEETGGNGMTVSTIYLAGGCFWGMQKFFDQFDGVTETQVGYANGPDEAPTYQQVCSDSGHAETVRIDYDPDKLILRDLLEYYFMVIDPLSVNRQGNDIGIQYRTGIYYTDEGQLPEIEAVYREEEEKAGAKLAVELEPLKNFFPAEEYHQKYLDKNPGGYCHIPDRYFHLE